MELHAQPSADAMATEVAAACAYGLSATRIAYGIAWKIALVAELLGAPSGLGYLMLRAQTAADSTTFLATCFAIVLIFMAGERLVIVPIERRFAQR